MFEKVTRLIASLKPSRKARRLEAAPISDPHPVPKAFIGVRTRRSGSAGKKAKSPRKTKRSRPFVGTFRHHIKRHRAAQRRQYRLSAS